MSASPSPPSTKPRKAPREKPWIGEENELHSSDEEREREAYRERKEKKKEKEAKKPKKEKPAKRAEASDEEDEEQECGPASRAALPKPVKARKARPRKIHTLSLAKPETRKERLQSIAPVDIADLLKAFREEQEWVFPSHTSERKQKLVEAFMNRWGSFIGPATGCWAWYDEDPIADMEAAVRVVRRHHVKIERAAKRFREQQQQEGKAE